MRTSALSVLLHPHARGELAEPFRHELLDCVTAGERYLVLCLTTGDASIAGPAIQDTAGGVGVEQDSGSAGECVRLAEVQSRGECDDCNERDEHEHPTFAEDRKVMA